MSEKKWRRFEKLVAKIQEELSPGAVVTHDERIPGRKSGTDRQVDVVIRQSVGQFNLLIVIDAKDYKTPADVTVVGQFIDLVSDIGANKGAMVSASGFTEAAKRRAAEAGIDLYRPVDAENEDWRVYVRIPVLWHFLRLNTYRCAIRLKAYQRIDEADLATLYDANGQALGSMQEIVARQWNAGALPQEAGQHDELSLHEGALFFRHEGRYYPLELTASIAVEKETYFGHPPLAEIRGFHNQITGGTVTRSFKTEFISYPQIRENWRRLNDVDVLAVSPALEVESVVHAGESEEVGEAL